MLFQDKQPLRPDVFSALTLSEMKSAKINMDSPFAVSASPLAAGGWTELPPFPLPHSLASHILPSASHSLDSQQEPYIFC